MTASELIAKLQALVAEHGDIEVLVDGDYYSFGVDDAKASDMYEPQPHLGLGQWRPYAQEACSWNEEAEEWAPTTASKKVVLI